MSTTMFPGVRRAAATVSLALGLLAGPAAVAADDPELAVLGLHKAKQIARLPISSSTSVTAHTGSSVGSRATQGGVHYVVERAMDEHSPALERAAQEGRVLARARLRQGDHVRDFRNVYLSGYESTLSAGATARERFQLFFQTEQEGVR